MTIAAGFVCSDGLLVCADAEISTATFKLRAAKVHVVFYDDIRLLITGAGDSDYLEYAYQQCDKAIKPGMSLDQVETTVRKVIYGIYKDHIYANPAYTGPPDATNCELIVGAWKAPSEFRLWRSSLAAFLNVRCFHIAGIGLELGRFVVDRFIESPYPFNLPIAVMTATAMLSHVKQYVQACGGASSIVALADNGEVSIISAAMDIENGINELEMQSWLTLRAAFCGTPEFLATHLDTLAEAAKRVNIEDPIRKLVRRSTPSTPEHEP